MPPQEGFRGLIDWVRKKGIVKRERTPIALMLWALFLYVGGASLRRVQLQLEHRIGRSHVAIWEWEQRFGHHLDGLFQHQDLPDTLVVDETETMENRRECYVWIALDPVTRAICYAMVSDSRSILTCLGFLQGIKRAYGRLPERLLTDGGMWYPWACKRMGIRHELVRGGVRNYVERFNETLKDRCRSYDKYTPCNRTCRLNHVRSWIKLLILDYNWVRPHQRHHGRPPLGHLRGSGWTRFKAAMRIALT